MFLTYLETGRGNTYDAATRGSLRGSRHPLAFLIKEEVKAILSAQDKDLWLGRRVTGLLTVAVQTGLRLSVSAEPPRAAID
ncbi:MAG: hypothetical protein U1D68_16800, partial [Arthrobacter sp.]|nr:hypothetical protein [Arthrobacter sp.]